MVKSTLILTLDLKMTKILMGVSSLFITMERDQMVMFSQSRSFGNYLRISVNKNLNLLTMMQHQMMSNRANLVIAGSLELYQLLQLEMSFFVVAVQVSLSLKT
jgi:hypothetical protein